MNRIQIKRLLGSDIVTREHGRKLYDLILQVWSDPPVVVDFEGLQVNSVSFFDESFGRLALTQGRREVDQRLRLEGLEKFDMALLKDIIGSRSREAQKRASG